MDFVNNRIFKDDIQSKFTSGLWIVLRDSFKTTQHQAESSIAKALTLISLDGSTNKFKYHA